MSGDVASSCDKSTRLPPDMLYRNRFQYPKRPRQRNLSYEEALNLGNILQDRADTLPGDEIVYAVSDRDSYRRTLELYLKDGVLTQAEQLLLWESEEVRHWRPSSQSTHGAIAGRLDRQGKSVQIHAFRGGMTDV